jgi:glutamate/tyrosine decarboxylase-like PLP-dependent enzyme
VPVPRWRRAPVTSTIRGPNRRGVAQPGSALRSGRRGPRFESGHPDIRAAAFNVAALCLSAASVRPVWEPSGVDVLEQALRESQRYLEGVAKRPVAGEADRHQLRHALGGPLADEGLDPPATLELLVRGAEPGIVATAGPRYLGFVIGGSLPVALAADWVASAWDQNAAFGVMSPAAAVVEEVTAGWLLDLLGLPPGAAVGFVTGAQMANMTCLAAARHHVLAAVGWDVERRGLACAPPVSCVVGEEVHVTLNAALRYLGLGAPTHAVEVDDQGRMDPESLRDALADIDGPIIVSAQAGNVNTGACDPLDAIADVCQETSAWLHVDGAFGLWAAADPERRHLVHGVGRADSWATDAHKWLNVPYDCGIAITAHPDDHRAAMSIGASYLAAGEGLRDGADWVPEASRRARAFPVWAAIRSLGRDGVRDLVARCCRHTQRIAERLAADGVTILNDVVLNQALASFGDDADTDAVIARVQRDGTTWVGGTTWRGTRAMRISVSGWCTTDADAEMIADAILRARDAA